MGSLERLDVSFHLVLSVLGMEYNSFIKMVYHGEEGVPYLKNYQGKKPNDAIW